MYKTTVTVEGMMCHMCEKHVNEAVSKAFGTGICADARLSEIEIRNDERGKPCLILHGKTRQYYTEVLKGTSADISLSHSDSAALAFAAILLD